jgi:hypothetical protein
MYVIGMNYFESLAPTKFMRTDEMYPLASCLYMTRFLKNSNHDTQLQNHGRSVVMSIP